MELNKIMVSNLLMMFGLLFILVACQPRSNFQGITPFASKDQASPYLSTETVTPIPSKTSTRTPNGRDRAVQNYPPPQGTPLPYGTSTPPVTSTMDEQSKTATAMSPTQGTEISITLPPPLVLTNQIGPLATPFPLVTPAPDAAGSITYLARDRDGTVSAYSLEVDQDGQVRSDPRVIARIDVPVDNVYPSPGGRRMALVGNRPQLNFLDLDTGEIWGLQTDLIVENILAWHPDNQRILIRGGGGLFLLNIDTGDTIQLATTVYSGGSFDEGAISPDGQKVIASFSRYVFDPVQTLIFNIDGSNERLLSLGSTRMDHFTWSPDGSKIAFVEMRGWL